MPEERYRTASAALFPRGIRGVFRGIIAIKHASDSNGGRGGGGREVVDSRNRSDLSTVGRCPGKY